MLPSVPVSFRRAGICPTVHPAPPLPMTSNSILNLEAHRAGNELTATDHRRCYGEDGELREAVASTRQY